jgi:hypothetical protein
MSVVLGEKHVFSSCKKRGKKKKREGDSDTYLDSMWLLKSSPKVAVPA